jgi:hypothetical protein
VTQHPNEVLHEDCVTPTFKQSLVRIMVWGCIMKGKKGPLVVVIIRGNPGVKKMYPYPYPSKPLPLQRVKGFSG